MRVPSGSTRDLAYAHAKHSPMPPAWPSLVTICSVSVQPVLAPNASIHFSSQWKGFKGIASSTATVVEQICLYRRAVPLVSLDIFPSESSLSLAPYLAQPLRHSPSAVTRTNRLPTDRETNIILQPPTMLFTRADALDGFEYYHYSPSMAAAIIFVIIFGVATALHFWQMLRSKTWFLIPFLIGGIFETVGYVGRALSAGQNPGPYTLGPYVNQARWCLTVR